MQMISTLLLNGIDANCHNSEALLWAAFYGHEPVVSHLLDAGADARSNDSTALTWAAVQGHVRIVQKLIDEGADVNADHGSQLIDASMKGRNDIVELLLSKSHAARQCRLDADGVVALLSDRPLRTIVALDEDFLELQIGSFDKSAVVHPGNLMDLSRQVIENGGACRGGRLSNC